MKLGTLLLRSLLVVVVLAAAGQWWLVQRTQDAAKRFVHRLMPYGELRYEKLWPWPWGAGRVWNLSFQPEGMLRLMLRTPEGFRVSARELRIHALETGDDGTLQRVRGTFLGVEIPVNPVHAPVGDAPDPGDNPFPTLYDLGYTHLPMDVDFAVDYVAASNLATVQLSAAGTDLGRAYLRMQLEGPPATFDRAPDQLVLRQSMFEFQDGGFATRFKDVAAARSHLNRAGWEQAVIEQLDRKAAAAKWRWDDASSQGVRRAISDSGYFTMGVDPPGDIVLHNLQLYQVGDWPRLLGFTFSADGKFDHPLPGKAMPALTSRAP